MKYRVFAIGLAALLAGAASIASGTDPLGTLAMERDTELRWRESSGPHGERNPVALPLYEAIFARNKNKVAALLDRRASPNLVLYPGRWSPLMLAISYNDHDIVRLLVKHGANVNYVSNDPATGTPLAAALSYGRLYTVEHPDIPISLFDSGPMDVYHPDFSIFYYLLDSGVDVNVEFRDVDIAIYAVTLGQIDKVNDLLARGYRRDLQKLKKYLEITRVSEKIQPEKEKAIAMVDRLMSEGK